MSNYPNNVNEGQRMPDVPEAPPHWDSSQASAWQSGWESGYAAALADMMQK